MTPDKERILKLLIDITHMSYDRAVDYLISRGVTVQQWFPAASQPPEESGDYLTLADNGCYYVLPYSAKNKAFNSFDDFDSHAADIPCDYWMPLPPKPSQT